MVGRGWKIDHNVQPSRTIPVIATAVIVVPPQRLLNNWLEDMYEHDTSAYSVQNG
jgi:hypothetical protein